ncbi:hypothetical protein D3C86_1567040 [compost metagenome]
MLLNDNAHVTRSWIAQKVGGIPVAQLRLYPSHGLDQLLLLWLRQALQHHHDFFTSGLLQRGQHGTTWIGELDLRCSGIGCRASPADQSFFLESADDAAEVASIQAEHMAEV